MPIDSDEAAMRLALDLAAEARRLGEVPVGAVVVRDRGVVAQGFNLRETLRDPTAHAERIALTLAGRALGSWRLEGCSLFVTLEPCVMCMGAVILARVSRVVFGATDPKAGACTSLYRLARDRRLNHRCEVVGGVLASDCAAELTGFFQDRRRRATKEDA